MMWICSQQNSDNVMNFFQFMEWNQRFMKLANFQAISFDVLDQ